MKHIKLISLAALGTCLATLCLPAPHAVAQTTPSAPDGQEQQRNIPPAIRQDIEAGLRYPLPADFMPRAVETLQALQAANIRPPDSTQISLQATIAQIASIPGLSNILNAHGFTPESFVMGMTAFGMTLAATNGQQLPAGFPAPNANNVALFHAHPEQVTTLMQAMGTPPGQGN